jgi:hypothetical protein
MRTNSESERNDALLEAMLKDESWQAASANGKAKALGVFQVRQRRRRLTRWAGSVAALAALTAVVAHWPGQQPAPTRPPIARTAPPASKASRNPRLLSDRELLAAFPKGSCFIAEVDGRKELVFFDPKVERAYMARGR